MYDETTGERLAVGNLSWEPYDEELLEAAEKRSAAAVAALAVAKTTDEYVEAAKEAWEAALVATEAVGVGHEGRDPDVLDPDALFLLAALWTTAGRASEVAKTAWRHGA